MKSCRRMRKAVSGALPVPSELEEHLFACSACRRFVRVEQILGLMHEFRQAPGSSSPEFRWSGNEQPGGKSRAATKDVPSRGHAVGCCTGVFSVRRLRFFCLGGWHKEHRVGCVPCGFTDSKRFDRDLRVTLSFVAVMRQSLIPSFVGTVLATKVAAIPFCGD